MGNVWILESPLSFNSSNVDGSTPGLNDSIEKVLQSKNIKPSGNTPGSNEILEDPTYWSRFNDVGNSGSEWVNVVSKLNSINPSGRALTFKGKT
jgi:hypothetical protein